jgi:hypothetical protein
MSRIGPRDPRTPVRADDWRDAGLCRRRGENSEDWFPVGPVAEAAAPAIHAKAVCWQCPSMQACGRWALENQEAAGIWGGLTESERRKKLRRRNVNLPDNDTGPEEKPERTLRTIWDARAKGTGDGHCLWNGGRPVGFQGRDYTPHQVGFILDRGREPVGPVRAECSVGGFILPAHVADQQEREARSRVGAVPVPAST